MPGSTEARKLTPPSPVPTPELPLPWHRWALQLQWEWQGQVSAPDSEAHSRRVERDTSGGCQHWCQALCPGDAKHIKLASVEKAEVLGGGRGDVIVPRAAREEEGGEGTRAWPQAIGLTGEGTLPAWPGRARGVS